MHRRRDGRRAYAIVYYRLDVPRHLVGFGRRSRVSTDEDRTRWEEARPETS